MDKMNKYLMPGRIMAEIIPEKMDLQFKVESVFPTFTEFLLYQNQKRGWKARKLSWQQTPQTYML